MRRLWLCLLLLCGSATPATAQIVCSVLVAPDGSDTPTCGAVATPCLTIQQGIDRAAADGASCVQVRAGVYPETLHLASGVDVLGGFDASWLAGDPTLPAFEARIEGGFDPLTQQVPTVGAKESIFN